MSDRNVSIKINVPWLTLFAIYGLITQCLSWAGVIDWPWQAMWAPLGFGAVITAVICGIMLVCYGIMSWHDRLGSNFASAVFILIGILVIGVAVILGVWLFFQCWAFA